MLIIRHYYFDTRIKLRKRSAREVTGNETFEFDMKRITKFQRISPINY